MSAKGGVTYLHFHTEEVLHVFCTCCGILKRQISFMSIAVMSLLLYKLRYLFLVSTLSPVRHATLFSVGLRYLGETISGCSTISVSTTARTCNPASTLIGEYDPSVNSIKPHYISSCIMASFQGIRLIPQPPKSRIGTW